MRCCDCDYRYECDEAEPDIVGFGYCRTREILKAAENKGGEK